MSEPKTYYGPWTTRPMSAFNGSLWEIEAIGLRGRCVSGRGGLIYIEDRKECDTQEWRCRRVYPPGSILPEPRSAMEASRLSDTGWWAIGQIHTQGVEWEFRQIEKWDFSEADYPLDEFLAYPVDRLENGAFVPRPWPDSGCTTE